MGNVDSVTKAIANEILCTSCRRKVGASHEPVGVKISLNDSHISDTARLEGGGLVTTYASEAEARELQGIFNGSRFADPNVFDASIEQPPEVSITVPQAVSLQETNTEDQSADHDHVEQLLASLLDIERQCLSVDAPNSDDGECPKVKTIYHYETSRAWAVWAPNGTRVTACMQHRLRGARCQDVLRALSVAEERLRWDGECFIEFKVLHDDGKVDLMCQGADKDDLAHRDVLYCAMKAPWPFRDREVLQNRWQLHLPCNELEGPGLALVMQSFEDSKVLPPSATRVRAFTYRSGYIMRPFQDDDGMEGTILMALSESNLGGNVPLWTQNMLTGIAARRSVSWVGKLLNFCKEHKSLT